MKTVWSRHFEEVSFGVATFRETTFGIAKFVIGTLTYSNIWGNIDCDTTFRETIFVITTLSVATFREQHLR